MFGGRFHAQQTEINHRLPAVVGVMFQRFGQNDVPFQRLQFNIPAYPRIMVNMDKLEDQEFMDALWRALDSVCEDWPTQLTENVVS